MHDQELLRRAQYDQDSGECGCHAASTNLVGKAYRSGSIDPRP
jgi:hypothetical protein